MSNNIKCRGQYFILQNIIVCMCVRLNSRCEYSMKCATCFQCIKHLNWHAKQIRQVKESWRRALNVNPTARLMAGHSLQVNSQTQTFHSIHDTGASITWLKALMFFCFFCRWCLLVQNTVLKIFFNKQNVYLKLKQFALNIHFSFDRLF